MTAFIPKKIRQEEGLGEKLQQARRQKNLKIENIAQQLGIKTEYLIALEEERFDKLPAGLYGKNFIKKYASFLGLDNEEISQDWQRQTSTDSPNDPFSRKILAKNNFLVFPKIIRNLLVVGAIAVCLLYLGFYFKRIILPPELIILYPADNLSLNATSLEISGQTEKEAEVTINGELVLNNQDGLFSQTVNLKKGLNSITIKAKKKYSREETVIRQILVE
ncbi:helix-turn-helix domain-containing protein [Candidatus Falkowbacteria bacterium]|jgi:cytoskeletal protein RodZ|nr:helix-turn-helix domain-containing protein [Candidatus Falkowbacteria bacterium]